MIIIRRLKMKRDAMLMAKITLPRRLQISLIVPVIILKHVC